MTARLALVLVLTLGSGLLCAGCVIHLERNAPGRIDPREPPSQPACRQVQEPEDPGEHQVTLSTGVLFGGGGDWAPGGGGLYALSAETTLHWGRRPVSHTADAPLFPLLTDRYYPPRSLGVTLGGQLLEGGERGHRFGHLYAELQAFSMRLLASGAAVGWAVDPTEGNHGPQVTLFGAGFVVLRFAYLIGSGAQLTFGLQVKLPLSWVWSQ